MRESETAMRESETAMLSVTDLRDLLEKQNYRCAVTGAPLTPENVGLDHIVPITRGGANSIKNCQFVLATINAAKGTHTSREFIELCHRVAEHHDRQ